MPQTPSSADFAKSIGAIPASDDFAKSIGAMPAQTAPPASMWDRLKAGVSETVPTPMEFLSGLASVFHPDELAKMGYAEGQRLANLVKNGNPVNPKTGQPASALNAVPFVGPQLGTMADNIRAKDYAGATGNAIGMAGLQLAAEGVGLAAKVPAGLAARAAAKAAQATVEADAAFTSDFMKAIPAKTSTPYTAADLANAKPYLGVAHAASPVEAVPHVVEAAQTGIGQIEDHIAGYIDANPTAILPTNPFRAAWDQLRQGVRSTDVPKGMEALRSLDLEQPMTLADADAKRLRLNAENKAVLAKDNSDVATARLADPKFAAREAAAQALRDGIYSKLDELGIPGVAELRQDEGSLIKIRNAAQSQAFSGDKTVSGTGTDSLSRRVSSRLVKLGSTGVGAAVGGGIGGPAGAAGGAVVGQEIGNELAAGIQRPNMTKDALVQRAFGTLQGPGPDFPPVPSPTTTSVAPAVTAPATALPSPRLRAIMMLPPGPARTKLLATFQATGK